MAELRDGVPLTELGVITRWSLAVRQSEAERADLIAELRADLAWLEKTSTRQTSLRKPPVAPPPRSWLTPRWRRRRRRCAGCPSRPPRP